MSPSRSLRSELGTPYFRTPYGEVDGIAVQKNFCRTLNVLGAPSQLRCGDSVKVWPTLASAGTTVAWPTPPDPHKLHDASDRTCSPDT